MSALKIDYVHRDGIDDERWNQLIASSGYGTVYAYTWYLDACADHWGALITGDYQWVMPLAFRRKMGVRYLYQPRFCQQLGVYSERDVDGATLRSFMLEMKKYFKLGSYALNEGNRIEDDPGVVVTDHMNYTLHLLPAYEALSGRYTTNCRRNVRKAADSGLVFSDRIPVEELVLLKREHDHVVQSGSHYKHLTNMFGGLVERGRVKSYGVRKDGVLYAGVLVAYCMKRMHYLLSVSSQAGRENHGMFLVIDHIIRRHAGNPVTLDFEGSNIPTIARFFRGFGAKPVTYHRITLGGTMVRRLQRIMNSRRHGKK
jgi:hypothetical protein